MPNDASTAPVSQRVSSRLPRCVGRAGLTLATIAAFAVGWMLSDAGAPFAPFHAPQAETARAVQASSLPRLQDRVLSIEGEIGPALHEAVTALPDGAFDVVVLNSVGGDVRTSVQLAAFFRERAVTTYVPEDGICFSACVALFQGGAERISAPSATFLIHYAVQETGDERFRAIASIAGTIEMVEMLIELGLPETIYDQIPSLGDWLLTAEEAREIGMVQRIEHRPPVSASIAVAQAPWLRQRAYP